MLRTWSTIAVSLTVVFSALILLEGLQKVVNRRFSNYETAQIAIAALLLGFTYYPLLRGHSLGQIQVFLGALAAGALLAQLYGYRVLAGALIGGCCLVKPQYALVAAWALMARDWKFLAGLTSIGAVGLALSVFEFGFENHVRYIDVLRHISLHGEAFWPNQTFNGFLHRLFSNGDATTFHNDAFAPHHPVVFAATLISSIVIVTVALWSTAAKSAADAQRDTLGLAIVLMAATVASPIAWEHHYGALLPVFAVVLPILWRNSIFQRNTGPLLLAAYCLIAFTFPHHWPIFDHPLIGIARSHLFVGALLLFALCVAAHRKWSKHALAT